VGHAEPPPAEFDVVIATRDRPLLLKACVEALERQTLDRFRVIVVDDGSGIPVAGSLPSLSGGHRSLVVLRNESPVGPAASRNRALETAGAPYLLFLDDDVRAHRELLVHHRAVFARRPGAVVSIGSLRCPPGARLPPWDLWQADRLAREEARLIRGEATPSWSHLYAGNVAVRRADFEAVGGFEPALARQEDVELGYRLARLGCSFVFEPRAVAWHDARHALTEWLRIPAANARCDVLIDRLQPGSCRLDAVRRGLRERHWLLRAARRASSRPRASRAAERLAIAAGRTLHYAGADRQALLAFSLVWDLEYTRALAVATATAATPSPAVGRGTERP
jgi:GT2 family glycosyltransferase